MRVPKPVFSLAVVLLIAFCATRVSAMPILPNTTYDLTGEITFLTPGSEWWLPELDIGTPFTGVMTSESRGCDTCTMIRHRGILDFGLHDLIFDGYPREASNGWNLDAQSMYFTNTAHGLTTDHLFMTIGADGTGTWGFAAYSVLPTGGLTYVMVNGTVRTVPEPSTGLLLLVGLAAVRGSRIRHRIGTWLDRCSRPAVVG